MAISTAVYVSGARAIAPLLGTRFVRSVFIRRSVATGDAQFPFSDLDLGLIVDPCGGDAMAMLHRRLTAARLVFPRLGEVQVTTVAELEEMAAGDPYRASLDRRAHIVVAGEAPDFPAPPITTMAAARRLVFWLDRYLPWAVRERRVRDQRKFVLEMWNAWNVLTARWPEPYTSRRAVFDDWAAADVDRNDSPFVSCCRIAERAHAFIGRTAPIVDRAVTIPAARPIVLLPSADSPWPEQAWRPDTRVLTPAGLDLLMAAQDPFLWIDAGPSLARLGFTPPTCEEWTAGCLRHTSGERLRRPGFSEPGPGSQARRLARTWRVLEWLEGRMAFPDSGPEISEPPSVRAYYRLQYDELAAEAARLRSRVAASIFPYNAPMNQTALVGALLMAATAVGAQQPATNYDETKVPSYTLPPLLVAKDGSPVRAAADWTKRRAEIAALLEDQMFGKAPGRPSELWFGVDEIGEAFGGLAMRKQGTIRVAGRTLALLVYLPAHAPKPVPVFVSLGFNPNQAVHADPGIHLAGAWAQDPATKVIARMPATEASRGSAASRWEVEQILRRGFGLATVYYGDIEPDFAGAEGLGVRAASLEGAKPGPGDWGAIAAWAWGLSRVADVLVQDRDIDSGKLALVGHSRLGKAALWAGALDPRFAVVISNDSGEGGAAISRRRFGETVADLNQRFPHWFCGNYRQYSDREETMPFDSPMLLALIAPRPLYVASAVEDQWADPKGEFLGAVAASEVYRLLGVKGLNVNATMPGVDQPVGDGDVRYHVRTGKHDITAYDWQQYLDFAARHFGPAR